MMNSTQDNKKTLLDELKEINQTLSKRPVPSQSKEVVDQPHLPIFTPLVTDDEAPDLQPDTAISVPSVPLPQLPQTPLNDTTLNDYLFETSETILAETLSLIKGLKSSVLSTGDDKSMTGYANLVKSASSMMDTLNAIRLEKLKHENAQAIKQLDFENKEKLQKAKALELAKTPKHRTIVTTRAEIIKLLSDNADAYEINPA